MSEKDDNNLSGDYEGDATRSLMQAVERMRTRLHEATVNAPPQIYQAIERLREIAQDRFERTEHRISQIAHELGETEDDLLEWLKLDIRTLERRMLQSLIDASDESRVELQRWLRKEEEEEKK